MVWYGDQTSIPPLSWSEYLLEPWLRSDKPHAKVWTLAQVWDTNITLQVTLVPRPNNLKFKYFFNQNSIFCIYNFINGCGLSTHSYKAPKNFFWNYLLAKALSHCMKTEWCQHTDRDLLSFCGEEIQLKILADLSFWEFCTWRVNLGQHGIFQEEDPTANAINILQNIPCNLLLSSCDLIVDIWHL